MTKQKRNNKTVTSNTETDSVSSSNPKSGGCPRTGVWKCFERGASKDDGHWEGTCMYCEKFYPRAKPNTLCAHLANSCKKIPEEWKRHFNYILVNNLEDIPTDEPLYGMPNSS
ncbi:20553_t:CDS:1 [Gigaspora rosea]|nr:20553_t:CDS:1 [Gigaspora rosea]